MKKIYLSLFLIAATFAVAFSQVPNAFNYQAVVRNASGEIISNQSVSFKISILKNSESGTVAYSETHTVTTNVFGLTNFEIGNGENTTGTFTPEGWGAAPHFVKVEFDPNGGSTFSHLATSKLASVPYAFHAQTVANDQVDDADADATNELQVLSLNGTLLELSNGGGSVTLPTSDGGGGDNWGAQKVVSNATLTGDGTSANPLAVVADGDGNDSNELQTLSLSGSNLSLSDGGGTVALPASPWSESSLEVFYRGNKSVYIGESSGSAAKTKSEQISDPAKLKVSVDNIPALEVYSESSVYSTVDIWNEEGIAARFGGNSDKPVAIFDNADVGLAAQFKDKIQIEDGTEGDGKVLTSDASGNASWQVPAAGGSSAWTVSGSDVYRASGKVGVGGAPTGTIKFDVKTDESWIAIKGVNNSPTYGSIFLQNNGSGPAADLRSPIRIMDGTQGTGKVLTSDVNGLASWQTPAAGGSSAWTESGSDVYRASGRVGIGTTSPLYELDILSGSAILGIKASSTHAMIYLDRKANTRYGYILYRTNSDNNFYVGLLGNNNYRINYGVANALQGLEVEPDGDINMSDDLKVEGEIHSANTGAANMMPVAYGNISSSGGVNTSSENISVSKTATGKYAITIENEFYYYTDYISVVTMVNGIGFVKTGSSSDNLLVFTYDTDGVLKDTQFSFVVYKP